jgi:hypothetical protein
MEIKQYFPQQYIGIKSFLTMLFGIAILGYSLFAVIALQGEDVIFQELLSVQQEDEVLGNSVMTLDCWTLDRNLNKVLCQKDVGVCYPGWREGSPPPPLVCSN